MAISTITTTPAKQPNRLRALVATILLLPVLLFVTIPHHAHATFHNGSIYRITINGIITIITTTYIERAITVAETSQATALVVQLGSEGAVLRVLPTIAQRIASASVPVVVYVTPNGTQSGAAGAFLLSAAHIAALAPNTSFGTPYSLVQLDSILSEHTQERVFDSLEDQLREWNQRQGRNTDWIDRAVREGAIVNNEQAIATTPPVVNIVAFDGNELLTLLEGRTVLLNNGTTSPLHTLGRTPIDITPTFFETFLLFLANPTITYMLLIVCGISLYAELAQPSMGVFAGFSLIFFIGALVGLVTLPIHWLSFAGLLFAFALITTDLFIPTHGGLTLTGIVLMIVSSLTLIDSTQAPHVFVALWAILLVVFIVAGLAALGTWLVVQLRHTPVATGKEGMIGMLAEVRQPLNPSGMVFVDGTLWQAECREGSAVVGEYVRIVTIQSLRLIVERVEQPANTSQ